MAEKKRKNSNQLNYTFYNEWKSIKTTFPIIFFFSSIFWGSKKYVKNHIVWVWLWIITEDFQSWIKIGEKVVRKFFLRFVIMREFMVVRNFDLGSFIKDIRDKSEFLIPSASFAWFCPFLEFPKCKWVLNAP